MSEIKTVLITGAGAPGIAGTIYALRKNNDGMPLRIITTDIKEGPIGGLLADKFFRVPPPEDADYLAVLKDIAVREGVHVILPQTTREVMTLAEHQDLFKDSNIKVVVSGAQAVSIANDKYLILRECERIGVPCPEYYLVHGLAELEESLQKLGYPNKKVVVKPRLSNGMRGLRILSEERLSLHDFLNEKPSGVMMNRSVLADILTQGEFPPMLVSEFLPGDEYSVDMFRNQQGIVCIPRLRQAIRSGISFHTRVDLRADIVDHCERLSQSLDLHYCFGFQFKLDVQGRPKILEANPRVQGTMIVSMFAGFNIIYAAVKEALGEAVSLENITLQDKLEFMRYWGGVAVNGQTVVGKI